MAVDLFNVEPLYQQVYKSIRDDIEGGNYKPSEQLPTESQFSKLYKVSSITIRQAVSLLVTDKLVYRRQGRGTFIAKDIDSHEFKKHKTIAFLAGYPKDNMNSRYEIIPEIIHVAEDECTKKGYSFSIFNTQNDLQKAKGRIKIIARGDVDGIIFWPILACSGDRINYVLMDAILSLRIPVVLFDRYLDGYDLDYVTSDNKQGAYRLINHLIDNGHRRIAVISDPPCSSINDRMSGYKQALQDAGIECDPQLIRRNMEPGSIEQTVNQVELLIKMRNPPTAIFATYDNLARAAMETLKKRGLSVPDDVAVVGYDNRQLASSLSLTTVDERCGEIASKAIKRVCEKIESKDEKIKNILVKSKLIIRGSSGRHSKRAKPIKKAMSLK